MCVVYDVGDESNDHHNGNTAKIHHVLLTCIALRGCEKELTCTLAEKRFQKVQQIHKGYCNGVYFLKKIVSITDECALKKNSATAIFYIATLTNLKHYKISFHGK